MFLEGEVNWTLVLGLITAASVLVALVSVWMAATRAHRHARATGELDMVQKVASAADRRLFQILNALPVAVVETDPNGKFVFANRAAHQLLGRRDAELLGLRFHSATWGITFPDGKPVPPDLLPSARALRGQTVRGFQHMLANPSTRRKILVAVTAMPIEDEYGRVIGSTAVMIDTDGLVSPHAGEPAPAIVTPVMGDEPAQPPEMAPAAPVPAPDLTRRVFEAASSALVVVGPDGVVREANAVARQLTTDEQALIGLTFADAFLPENERAGAGALLAAALVGGEDAPEVLESPGSGDEGVRWRMLPLAESDGGIDALLLVGERLEPAAAPADPVTPQVRPDTGDAISLELETARRAAEAAAQEAAALRAELDAQRETARSRAEADSAELDGARRMEAVGRLTGGVAHDFNALLAVMTSALDMLLKQADDPARVRRLGQAALAAGQRGELLTRRLTAFTQGDETATLEPVEAGALLRGLESRLRGETGDRMDLMVEGPSEPTPLRLDPVAFEGAVRALVRNAVEASGEGASVALRLERLEAGGARLSVRDAGPGMTPDIAARAAEPFFTTRPGQAGLGLSQVYAFARQSGGVLEIDSRPGEGTEAAVLLPAGG